MTAAKAFGASFILLVCVGSAAVTAWACVTRQPVVMVAAPGLISLFAGVWVAKGDWPTFWKPLLGIK